MVLGLRARACQISALSATALAATLVATPAWADTADPPRFGPAPTDEQRSTGRQVAPPRARPAGLRVAACSFVEPACVHVDERASPTEAAMRALRAAERALSGYRALGFPPPRGRYDLYLDPASVGPTTVADLVPTSDGWDRASAFTVMPPPSTRGCGVEFDVAASVAHAITLGLDAGVEPGAIAMTASYLASLVASCAEREIPAVDAFQASPEHGFIAGDPDRADGSMLFPRFLDDALGVGGPGRAMLGAVAIAAQKTPAGAWEWNNEPDTFDVLRATMKSRGSSLDALLLDFAVARAFAGTRDDGKHMTDVEWLGDAGRVRFEWAVPYASLPRRLAPLAPIEPTGMTYLWVDLASRAPSEGEITFVADWEPGAVFRWSLLKIDKDGAEAGRFDLAGVFGETHAERTLVGLDGLSGLVVVGVNVGSEDRSHPFDPDEQPLSPHGYAVTFAK